MIVSGPKDVTHHGPGTLTGNRPTPDPSQEGSQQATESCQSPSWEGLRVGSMLPIRGSKVRGRFP